VDQSPYDADNCWQGIGWVKIRQLPQASLALKSHVQLYAEPPQSKSETRDMSKKQLVMLALVASVPAAGLLIKMLLSLLHLLSDQSSASVVLWLVYVVCLLGSAFIAFLPLLLWLYYPAAGFETVAVNAAENFGTDFHSGVSDRGTDDDEYEENASGDDDVINDEGEALFDDDAMGEDFDEFEGEFDVADEDDK